MLINPLSSLFLANVGFWSYTQHFFFFLAKISQPKMATPNRGARQATSCETITEFKNLGHFTIKDHNKKKKINFANFPILIGFLKQLVAGTLHHLTLKAIESRNKKIYEAKICVKPWLNIKELQEFKHASDAAPSFTPFGLRVKRDFERGFASRYGHGQGRQAVPNHDPQVQDETNHVVHTIQHKSNSLFPYELQEFVHAKAEFDLLLKVKRGTKEEKYMVEVHKRTMKVPSI
ncbi:hypothetical protein UlMin_005104 [Ulmus minor]